MNTIIKLITVNITLEFETNYKAYTDAYQKLETQSITLSVRKRNDCY